MNFISILNIWGIFFWNLLLQQLTKKVAETKFPLTPLKISKGDIQDTCIQIGVKRHEEVACQGELISGLTPSPCSLFNPMHLFICPPHYDMAPLGCLATIIMLLHMRAT